MAYQHGGHHRSPVVGDLYLPAEPPDDPAELAEYQHRADELQPMLVELNVRYPGGLTEVRVEFYKLWEPLEHLFHEVPAGEPPAGLQPITSKLLRCVLRRRELQDLLARDRDRAPGAATAIFRVWPDYPLRPQIDRSAPTVKADAAWRSYNAGGQGVVWAVLDTGIDASHPHFSTLELHPREDPTKATGRTDGLHRDFTYLVGSDGGRRAEGDAGSGTPDRAVREPTDHTAALQDRNGHGTHVAGIIAGCTPKGSEPRVALSGESDKGGFVQRPRVKTLSGMAPACELVSIKVVTFSDDLKEWVTSSSAVIRALTYLRTEVNADPGVLRVHGVNLSLGCAWEADHYAAGQSPLCQAVNQVVASGVAVVISAGNDGARTGDNTTTTFSVLGSITEPAHAEDCIAVGSTHREAPHAFGITWTSSKGPTLDGRMKPDVVAPGEWISSAATGKIRTGAGLDPDPAAAPVADQFLTYAEQSGTSMAAPHVSGVIAAFLSARPEFIGRPRDVKRLLMESATDLGRERYAQGAGLVDLMRMLSCV